MRMDRVSATYDVELGALAGLASAADKVPYFTGAGTASVADFTAAGRALVDDASAAAQRVTLGVSQINRLIASITSANMNIDTDQALTMALTPTKYIIRKIVATNASTSLTTAVGGIYTGAGKTGVTIVANTQVYSALSAAAKFVDLTLAAGVTADVATAATIFLSLTTPQGGAATADLYVFGDILTA